MVPATMDSRTVPQATVAGVSMLAVINATMNVLGVLSQLSGQNVAPGTVEAQTALQLAVTGASPNYIYGSLLAINRTADLSAAVATLSITTTAPNGTYAPRVRLCASSEKFQSFGRLRNLRQRCRH